MTAKHQRQRGQFIQLSSYMNMPNSNDWAFNSAEAALTVRGMRLKSLFFSKTAADFLSALASPTDQLNC